MRKPPADAGSVYDASAARLLEAVRNARPATVEGPTDQGPLIDAQALAKVEEHFADARAQGREGRLRRQAPRARRTFDEPTVVTTRPATNVVARGDLSPGRTFVSVQNEAQAIQMAND